MGPIQTLALENTEEEIYCEESALIRYFRYLLFQCPRLRCHAISGMCSCEAVIRCGVSSCHRIYYTAQRLNSLNKFVHLIYQRREITIKTTFQVRHRQLAKRKEWNSRRPSWPTVLLDHITHQNSAAMLLGNI
jgi:hypothetical protein